MKFNINERARDILSRSVNEAASTVRYDYRGVKIIRKNDVTQVYKNGKLLASGDFDRGADGWFMNSKTGKSGSQFVNDFKEMLDFALGKSEAKKHYGQFSSNGMPKNTMSEAFSAAELEQGETYTFKTGESPFKGEVRRVQKTDNGYKIDVVNLDKNKLERVEVSAEKKAFEKTQITEAVTSESVIAQLQKIVDEKQYQSVKFKDGKTKVDLTTANAVLTVLKALKNPKTVDKVKELIQSKAGFMTVASLAFKSFK